MQNKITTKVFFINAFIVGLLSALFLPMVASAQTVNIAYPTTLLTGLRFLINAVIPVLVGLALVFFIWGIVVFIANSGNEQEQQVGKQKMIWGIVALFVIVAVWGLVEILVSMSDASTGDAGLEAPEPLGSNSKIDVKNYSKLG